MQSSERNDAFTGIRIPENWNESALGTKTYCKESFKKAIPPSPFGKGLLATKVEEMI